MLTRLAPLALVLAACHHASDSASSRLVGKWKHDLQHTKAAHAQCLELGQVPAESLAKVGAEIAWAQPDGGEWFRADGTWSVSSYPIETVDEKPIVHDATLHGTWKLDASDGERVSIVIPGDETFDDWRRSLVFESPDVIREVGGDWDGMRYRRVREE